MKPIYIGVIMNFLTYAVKLYSLRAKQFKNCKEGDLSGHMGMRTGEKPSLLPD